MLFPSQTALASCFINGSPTTVRSQNRSLLDRSPPFQIWSVKEDIKNKTSQIGNEISKEYAHASQVAQKEVGGVELYSLKYYMACTLGGILACGVTHTAVTPLDLVKCRRQVDSKLYKGNFEAWGKIARAEGFRGIFTGWSPTFFGYSVSIASWNNVVLMLSRFKVVSNTEVTSSSKNGMLILLAKRLHINTRLLCI